MPDIKRADTGRAIKVGVIADQTGPLSVMGLANANVARMVIGDLNAKGGLLGRHVELCLEDSETNDVVAAARAAKLVDHDRVDVVFGGIYSSTRQAIKQPVVVKGRTLYIYPEQYEGQESDPLIFCTGPVPAQQVDPFIPWLMRKTGAKTFYLPSADYIWPHVMNQRVREVVTAHGGSIVGEEYFALDHTDYRATVDRIVATGADVVFNTIVPPGLGPFFARLHDSGFTERGGSAARDEHRYAAAAARAELCPRARGPGHRRHCVEWPMGRHHGVWTATRAPTSTPGTAHHRPTHGWQAIDEHHVWESRWRGLRAHHRADRRP